MGGRRDGRTVERRRLVAAASHWSYGLPKGQVEKGASRGPVFDPPFPTLTERQRQIVASAVAAQRLDDLRADTADARRILGRVVDELADRVDPSLRRRREARLRAAAAYRRVFGGAAA